MATLYHPVTLTANHTDDKYDITIDVDYIHSDTYLSVYKYTVASDSSELVKEVSSGFTGSIKTRLDIYTEVYVQMYPNCVTSSATFDIHAKKVTDDGLTGGEIAGIVIGVLAFLIIVGLIIAYVVYVKYFKKRKNTAISAFPSTSKTQDPVARNNDNIFFIEYPRQVLQKPSYQFRTDVAHSQPRIQNLQNQEDTANAGALNSEPISSTFRESESDQAPHNI